MSSPAPSSLRIAVVGAGVAGLTCARELVRLGASVTVFDEGANPGGRVATQVTAHGHYDHGAQYFTVMGTRFAAAAGQWTEQGLVCEWTGRVIAFSEGRIYERAMTTPRYVAQPGMSDLARHIGRGLDLCLGTRIECVDKRSGLWQLYASDGRILSVRGFDALAVATPSPQAIALLKGHTELVHTAATVQWMPCWVVMLALSQASGVDFDGAFINDDPILGWVSRDSAKPGRAAVMGVAERWVLHAKPRWSQDHEDIDAEQAQQWLLRSFSARVGKVIRPRAAAAHQWRYATAINPLSQLCLWDSKRRVGMAGDWCSGPRVEDAYLSGMALAEAISRQLW